MRSSNELCRHIESIDRRGYPALKDLRGTYDFGGFTLSIDHVQGDPFAAPSSLSVRVPASRAEFPAELFRPAPHRRVALEDYLVRSFSRALSRRSFRVGGSGKSGLLATSRPGPEILERSACTIDQNGDVVARFEAGFPAHGRSVDARALLTMLRDLVPQCVHEALLFRNLSEPEVRAVVDLADDQRFIRSELQNLGLVSFVADGSVLPRATGVSSKPLAGAVPLSSPDSLRVVLDLPHRGPTPGMGIPRGVTLIVGGGYHGKSTLLKAIETGVYNHVAGDGREYVITDSAAMKLRAEDGRSVRNVDVSMFIDGLPNGRDTHRFSTDDASGSTSQAASTIEAVETGCKVLLIDEDTSATNFMVRDRLMAEVVSRGHEPIVPFVERVRDLYEQAGVSTVIVAGSSGAFFYVADTVIQMDSYHALDVTQEAKRACEDHPETRVDPAPGFTLPNPDRFVRGGGDDKLSSRTPQTEGRGHARANRDGRDHANDGGRDRTGRRPSRDDRIKVHVRGIDSLQVADASADLRLVEQLVDAEQTNVLARMVKTCIEEDLFGSCSVREAVDLLFERFEREGF